MERIIRGSEFKMFLDVLKMLGIPHQINWQPPFDVWQKIMTDAGYNLTARATTEVSIGETEYLFMNSEVAYTEQEDGIGPADLYLLSRDSRTGEVIDRHLRDDDNGFKQNVVNLEAIECEYPNSFWHLNAFRDVKK